MSRAMPTPPGATQRLPQISAANELLLSALAAHPAFRAQSLQRAGKVYFMHDFAQRTGAMIDSIVQNTAPPDTPATRGSVPNVPPADMSRAQLDELRGDAVGRCIMLQTMISDTSGRMGVMFGEAPGQGVDLGDAVRRAAKNVVDVIEGKEAGGA